MTRRRGRLALALAVVASLMAPVARTRADGGDSTRVEPQTPGGGQSWLEATHITPPPQPPLVTLDAEGGVAPVREAFRAGDGATRIVLVMSPT